MYVFLLFNDDILYPVTSFPLILVCGVLWWWCVVYFYLFALFFCFL